MKFSDLNLQPLILKALEDKGYIEPTPIQAKAIPPLLEGRDIIGCAQTGTGKTASFSIPILHHLITDKKAENFKKGIKALIITPTRELAIQIDDNFAAYSKNSGLRHTVIFGGVKQNAQVQKLKSGVDVLTATPGRLLDLMNQGFILLDSLQFFTLDEADRMLDMGFINDIKKIIQHLPKKRQSLFFSATMPPVIAKLAGSLLTDPVKVEVAPVSSTADTIEQALCFVEKGDKNQLLLHLAKQTGNDSILVFTRTKHGANKVVTFLEKNGITAAAIHGGKSQNARQRALKSFKDRATKILVATDIAARGIDIQELAMVVNFELPNEPETYVHRIGRTGRAKNEGYALSFCDREEFEYLRDIQKLIGKKVPLLTDHPFSIKPTADDLKYGKAPKKKQIQRPPRRNRR